MPTPREYIRHLLRDSIVVWGRGQNFTKYGGIVLGSLLLLFLLFGYTVLFKPEAGLWTSAALVLWFVVVVLVVSPYRIWKVERVRVEKYEDDAKPKISVAWRFRNVFRLNHSSL